MGNSISKTCGALITAGSKSYPGICDQANACGFTYLLLSKGVKQQNIKLYINENEVLSPNNPYNKELHLFPNSDHDVYQPVKLLNEGYGIYDLSVKFDQELCSMIQNPAFKTIFVYYSFHTSGNSRTHQHNTLSKESFGKFMIEGAESGKPILIILDTNNSGRFVEESFEYYKSVHGANSHWPKNIFVLTSTSNDRSQKCMKTKITLMPETNKWTFHSSDFSRLIICTIDHNPNITISLLKTNLDKFNVQSFHTHLFRYNDVIDVKISDIIGYNHTIMFPKPQLFVDSYFPGDDIDDRAVSIDATHERNSILSIEDYSEYDIPVYIFKRSPRPFQIYLDDLFERITHKCRDSNPEFYFNFYEEAKAVPTDFCLSKNFERAFRFVTWYFNIRISELLDFQMGIEAFRRKFGSDRLKKVILAVYKEIKSSPELLEKYQFAISRQSLRLQ